MNRTLPLLAALATGAVVAASSGTGTDGDRLKVLLIDGQNNHDWKATTPVLVAILEQSGRFDVEVATSPPNGGDLEGFQPDFAGFDVVVSNYNGELWGEAMRNAFVEYVDNGGGFVSVHAANNSFPQWPEYNRMIGVGGWGGRNEQSGPYVRWREGGMVKDTSPGRGGSHGPRHEFLVVARTPDHPVTAGLPREWMHAEDELYDRLRGPAEDLTVLATAYSAEDRKGTGENEPMLMTVGFGKGRVFHTTLGHDVKAMSGVGFQASLLRGTEWAATGKVTFEPVDAGHLPADKAAYRTVEVEEVAEAR